MINAAGAELISSSESIRLKAYLCPAGIPTIGRGHTHGITHQMVKDGYTITVEQERELFRQDMEGWERDVLYLLERKPNENQLAAMISLAFNIGLKAFKTSSVVKAYERYDDTAASRAFGLWNKATVNGTKVVLPGLVTRRAREAALYLTPVDAREMETMPQAVEPPKSMASSKINQASVVAGASTALATINEVTKHVTEFKGQITSLEGWIIPGLLLVGLCAIGYIVYERFQQRKQGNA